MSAAEQLARTFLESTSGYSDQPVEGYTPSQDRPVRLGTVDVAYTGAGSPMVLFDGETIMGVRTYSWVGNRPTAGERVVLLPQGRSFVILGTVDAVPGANLPTGTMLDYMGTTVPTGFLAADGTVVLRATYPALFLALSTTYNTGGETGSQFRLPNPVGRNTVGKGTGYTTLGATGGAATVALSGAEMPSHRHNVTRGVGGSLLTVTQTSAADGAVANRWHFADGSATLVTDLQGSGTAHQNMAPYIVVNKIIRY